MKKLFIRFKALSSASNVFIVEPPVDFLLFPNKSPITLIAQLMTKGAS